MTVTQKLRRLGTVALFAAIAAFVAVIAYIRLDKPDASANEHFGLVDACYSPDDTLPITDLAGDTDVVSIDAVVLRADATMSAVFDGSVQDTPALNVSFSAAEGRMLSFGAKHVHHGTRIGSYVPEYRYGFVEKLIGGEWQTVGGVSLDHYDNTEPKLLGAERSSTLQFAFPIHDAGKYRITYYFRDFSLDRDALNVLYYSTGEELYSVSHTVTVPEPSDKPFDLIAAGIDASGRPHETNVMTARLLFRSNSGAIPYLDTARVHLETTNGDRWVDAPTPKEVNRAAFAGGGVGWVSSNNTSANEDLTYEFRHPFFDRYEKNCFAVTAHVFGDPSAQYRLILEFNEGEHRSGETYVLTLYLNFSKEASQ